MMMWLSVIVVIVMAAGLVATVVIGQSKSNKEENPQYSEQTGRKWLRLGVMYLLGILIVAILLIALRP